MDSLKMAAGRPVYIWGVVSDVRTALLSLSLKRYGAAPSAFVDRDERFRGRLINGLTVLSPADALAWTSRAKPFFIIMPPNHYRDIAEQCERRGLAEGSDFLAFYSLFARSEREYSIEITGDEPGRHLSPTGLAQVLDKLSAEEPKVWELEFFNWNQPLKHPQLPRMIELARQRNFFPVIRFYHDDKADLGPLLEAEPTLVSLRLGRDGAIDHLRLARDLGRLADKYGDGDLKSLVHIDFQLFKDSSASDYRRADELCTGLGLTMKPHHGYCPALEEVALWPSRNPGSRQILSVPEALVLARRQREKPCGYRNSFIIDSDLSLRPCYNRKLAEPSAGAYLLKALSEMIQDRSQSALCRDCRAQGLHRYPSICEFYRVQPPRKEPEQ